MWGGEQGLLRVNEVVVPSLPKRKKTPPANVNYCTPPLSLDNYPHLLKHGRNTLTVRLCACARLPPHPWRVHASLLPSGCRPSEPSTCVQVQVTNDDKLTLCMQLGVMLSVDDVRRQIVEQSSSDTSSGKQGCRCRLRVCLPCGGL